MSTSEVVLHIGAFKTGTSFIQAAMSQNKQRLAEAGVLFPGPTWPSQIAAVRALAARPDPTAAIGARKSDAWDDMVQECRAWPGSRAVISMEFLAASRRAVIQAAVESFAPTPVRIVLGARTLVEAIPAQWQESLQSSGRTWTLDEYTDAVMLPVGQFTDATTHFWRKHNWQRILTRWAEFVPREKMVLLTFPPPGSPPEVLWHRFGDAAGFDARDSPIPQRANESLGAASLELVRRINEQAAATGRWTGSNPRFRTMCKRVLATRRSTEQAVTLRPDAVDWVDRRTEQLLRKIDRLGPQVVGDLDDLRSGHRARRAPSTTQPETTSIDELAGVAEFAAAGLAASLGRPAPAPGRGTPAERMHAAITAVLGMVIDDEPAIARVRTAERSGDAAS